MSGYGHLVLLHGLGRTFLSMKVPELYMRNAGFDTLNLGYPSRSRTIEELADLLEDQLGEWIEDDGRPVHFLTHSMGGIVVRYMLSRRRPQRLGRVVMLCPPNQGNEIADRFGDNPLFRVALGPAGQQLGKSESSIAEKLGPVNFELGIITGNRGLTPLGALVPGESDGKVSIEEAKVEGMQDFLVVPSGHTFIMNVPAVLDQAEHFLLHGRFKHD